MALHFGSCFVFTKISGDVFFIQQIVHYNDEVAARLCRDTENKKYGKDKFHLNKSAKGTYTCVLYL